VNDAADSAAGPLGPVAAPERPAPGGTAHRGRLFRKYLLLIITLVTSALLASGAISIYFTYQETRSSLASLQHEKAVAAAARIEQYIHQIDQQLAYAALPQLDAGDAGVRRIELLKLLRQTPEITDVAQLDGRGREQIAVSRLGMDSIDSGRDRSQEAAFREPGPGRHWYGPVYFRKDTEPYMKIATRSGGDKGAVTVADINLKFIWDVVTRIRIGEKGKAYVVDGNGFLVADPDIGLVLRKTDLSNLPHVRAATATQNASESAMTSVDAAGTQVLTSFAPIESLRWNVFVEQPVAEVYEKLHASVLRSVLLLVAGLALSALGAWALARGMARPIRTLDEGAQRIGSGDLEQTIEIHTGDELEALADQFNRMTGRLRESYAGLERKVEERTHELQNALEQQTAISEILRVIANSPTDVHPMLRAVTERALKLCDASESGFLLVEGDELRFIAGYGAMPTFEEGALLPLSKGLVVGRAIITGKTIHCADVVPLLDTEFTDAKPIQEKFGFRALLAVPLMREDRAIGGLALWRTEPRGFTERQIALVQTFADQAAIAIENVRLFNETREALEQQTAISEILRLISSSPADASPMLNAVAQRALRLCEAVQSTIVLLEGDELRFAAGFGETPTLNDGEALPLTRGSVTGRCVIDRAVIHVEDLASASESEFPVGRELQKRIGHRAILSVPLMRENHAIGAIALWRMEPRPFTDKQIALVRTFADQAAIAIENVRLFNETREALEQQTSVAEILRVISSSPTDVQPVLEAIAERAARLCDAASASMYLIHDDVLRHLASKGPSAEPVAHVEALPINRESLTGRAVLERRAIQLPDLLAEADEYPVSHDIAKRMGHRAVLVVPLMREGHPFGAILLRRQEVKPFGEREVALLRTFGDQAAIALENVRLFNETKEALDQQRASGEVLAAISNSIADTAPVFEKILSSCERLFEGKLVRITLVGDDGLIHLAAYHGPGREELEGLFPFPVDANCGTGMAILRRDIVHIPDVGDGHDVPDQTRRATRALGIKSVVYAPMMWEGNGIGAISIGRDHVGRFSDKDLALLKTFTDQAVIAIQNARLFREIEDKSRQLEVANKHKSDFLANMSHELRTPLNAIIGFSEVLLERFFGDVNEKQDDYLKDIHSSGKHLLSLINDILDLSKVEAGRMELEPTSFDLPAAVDNAMTLIRERAQRHNVALSADVDTTIGEIVADERKFKQILLNLLSNAVKFTPDGGRIDVTARRADGRTVIAVRDTGVGIAAHDQAAVFEEFRQVGSDYTRKQEGTGLGLALTRRFVELHGGRIWLESAPGKGSTFTFTIPTRQ